MTMQAESPIEVLGLVGSFPRPGWVVLDAIRERRFTGEVVFATSPDVRVYADLGRIYLAERTTDPSLGSRLVDAGALNAAQLEHGAVRVIDDAPTSGPRNEYLGRLFERVPSVDRHVVMVTMEMMNDECVGWLAGQRISDIDVTPYRHHPSGVQRWDRPFGDLAPGDPLPAPSPDAAPVPHAAPAVSDRAEPLFTPIDSFDADGVIQWSEPSWLDERPPKIDLAQRLAQMSAATGAGVAATTTPVQPAPQPDVASQPVTAEPTAHGASDADDAADKVVTDEVVTDEVVTDEVVTDVSDDADDAGDDWINYLDTIGLPERGSDPLATTVRLPEIGADPIDRFELIWPSGEIDEQFGAATVESPPHPDYDRAGPTARVVRDGGRSAATVTDVPAAITIPSNGGPDTMFGDGLEAANDAGLEAETDDALVVDIQFLDDEIDADIDRDVDEWAEHAEAERSPGLTIRRADEWLTAEHGDAITDDVVMAVRRAVASIETGSLAARRRLAEAPGGEPRIGLDPLLPGRVALRFDNEPVTASPARTTRPIVGSVFDDPPGASTPQPIEVALPADSFAADAEEPRTSALRRLIGSLRRR